jgi:carbamoyltransferase
MKSLLALKDGVLEVPDWTADFNQPYMVEAKWEDSSSMQHWRDLAWQVQDDTEKVLIERAIWLRETTGPRTCASPAAWR